MTNHSEQSSDRTRPLQAFGPATLGMVRAELVRLAAREDELATEEAGRTAYWEATPASVLSRRLAARILREAADQIPSAPSPTATAPVASGWS